MAQGTIKIEIDAKNFVEAANRLSDALFATELGWQSMETAPKDGTPILGYANRNMAVVTWYDICGYWSLCELGGLSEYAEWSPSHWRSLPQPPEDQDA